MVIWLGEDNGSAPKAIAVVQKAAHYARVEAGCDGMIPDQITFEEPLSERKLHRDLPALHHPDWAAVYWLFVMTGFSECGFCKNSLQLKIQL